MALSIGNILYISLLLTNSVAILNEERFLAKIGWTQSNNLYQEQTVKTRLINLISAVRTLMRCESHERYSRRSDT
ncbi:hypothetical protein E3Q22_02831 [Wallemia mellicola]|uniref:Yos1-like protein n=1 Tax=Wallemia mellicola TaxID=1708541 RepID=A0A4T0TID5_9BASI|nr:hypothetical protein E3Q24_02384 [Wallemia mellicola]TIB75021.1 hypothetical protein E3Q23_02471 [Wallemia mellicola]TIB77950.1 hypothetical protein E3Q22_02831 [Wallemia mellicola]TIB83699.1 hypothetical protein E3Q21_02742 [Wallemia mellicola]TIB86728.1 hypothetical protein E3Q20_02734 [Wallemia mellicola]